MLDSDAFKTRLPEWEGYLARDPLSSNVADLARAVPVNRGLAEEVVPLKPDLALAGALPHRGGILRRRYMYTYMCMCMCMCVCVYEISRAEHLELVLAFLRNFVVFGIVRKSPQN